MNSSDTSDPLGAIVERLEERVAQALYAASSRYFCAEDEHAAFEDCRRQARVVLRAIAGELCSVCSGAGLRRIGVITSEGDA